jgi:hypothetical protein
MLDSIEFSYEYVNAELSICNRFEENLAGLVKILRGLFYEFNKKKMSKPTIVCFGEVLWDVVKDTIGSGDAFLAGFLSEKLNDKSPQKCLKKACALGAYVSTQAGGTPPMALNI